mmetsp:Transcript_23090/g.37076  ORF Transcript_23090/g.37076 Transcript_23090/m.37076 type:complete len:200 (-) Transcript_23090:796-1395(-)
MDVAALYLQVIRNVVDGVRADFSTEQLDETSLRTLATLWEHKVLETGSLTKDTEEEVEEKKRKRAELAARPAGPGAQGVKRKADNRNGDSVPSLGGEGGNEKEGDAKEGDENGKAIVTVEAVDAKIAAALDKGETLSSDSDEDAPGINGEDGQSTNLVLAQFEKVARTKSKWKCTLKEGVMTLNSKDVLFGKASGEFFW